MKQILTAKLKLITTKEQYEQIEAIGLAYRNAANYKLAARKPKGLPLG